MDNGWNIIGESGVGIGAPGSTLNQAGYTRDALVPGLYAVKSLEKKTPTATWVDLTL